MFDSSNSDDSNDSKNKESEDTRKNVKVKFTPGSKGKIENLAPKSETVIDLTKTSRTAPQKPKNTETLINLTKEMHSDQNVPGNTEAENEKSFIERCKARFKKGDAAEESNKESSGSNSDLPEIGESSSLATPYSELPPKSDLTQPVLSDTSIPSKSPKSDLTPTPALSDTSIPSKSPKSDLTPTPALSDTSIPSNSPKSDLTPTPALSDTSIPSNSSSGKKIILFLPI